ncbi:DMT family transporter [Patescibacteria group bacterium]
MNKYRLRAYLLLLIVAVIWGIAGPVIKVTLNHLPPSIFLTYRFFIASVVALIIFIFQKGIKIPKKSISIPLIIGYTLLNTSISLGLLFWGTSKTSLLDMSLISMLGPIAIAIAGYVFLKDRITKREKIGISIAFIGSLIIVVAPLLRTNSGAGDVFGNLLILAFVITNSLSGVLLKKILRLDINALTLANLQFVVGFISFLPFIIFKYGLTHSLTIIKNASLYDHLGVIYMAIISGTIAYALANKAQRSIELSEAAPFGYLNQVFSAMFAITLLGDKLTTPIIIGSLITFTGIFLAEIKKKRYNVNLS